MAYTYEDFLETVAQENVSFVEKLHELFIQAGCKLEIKEAKQKCKNRAFFWKVCPESMEPIEKMVENELKFCDADVAYFLHISFNHYIKMCKCTKNSNGY